MNTPPNTQQPSPIDMTNDGKETDTVIKQLLMDDGLSWGSSLLCVSALSRLLQTMAECTAVEASSAKGGDLLERRCGQLWIGNHAAYRCRTCGITDSSCLCVECFNPDQHKGHDWRMYTSDTGGCCDCGDREAWLPTGWCVKHQRSNDPQVLAANAHVLAIPTPLSQAYETVGHHLIHALRKTFAFGLDRPWSAHEHTVNVDLDFFLNEINSSPMKKHAIAHMFCSLQPINVPITATLLGYEIPNEALFLDISLAASLMRASSFLRPTTVGKLRLLVLSLTLLPDFKSKFTHDFLTVFPFLVKRFVDDATISNNNGEGGRPPPPNNNNGGGGGDDDEDDGNEDDNDEQFDDDQEDGEGDGGKDLSSNAWDGPWLMFSRPPRTSSKSRTRSFSSTMSHLWCQLFHNEETTLYFVHKSDLLQKMLDVLTLMFGRGKIDLTTRLFKHTLFSRIFSDLSMVFSHAKVGTLVLQTPTFLDSVLKHYVTLHGMDPQTRVDPPNNHVVFESQLYRSAWLLEQEFDMLMFPVWGLLRGGPHAPLAASHDDVRRHVLQLVTATVLNTFPDTRYQASSNTYSAHITLTRLWAVLVSYCGETATRDAVPDAQLQLVSNIVAKQSIRVLGMMSQIEQKKWARNGQNNTLNQLFWYRVSRFWTYHTLDADTTALQMAATYGGWHDDVFPMLVEECGLERALKYAAVTCSDALPQSVSRTPPLDHARGVARRVLIHALAVKDLPFSEMEQYLDPREDKMDVRTILHDIADFRAGTPGVFILRPECWKEVELLSYSRWGQQEEDIASTRLTGKGGGGNSGGAIFPTIQTGGTPHPVFHDKAVMDSICMALERAGGDDVKPVQATALHGLFRISLMLLLMGNAVGDLSPHLDTSSRLVSALIKLWRIEGEYLPYRTLIEQLLVALGSRAPNSREQDIAAATTDDYQESSSAEQTPPPSTKKSKTNNKKLQAKLLKKFEQRQKDFAEGQIHTGTTAEGGEKDVSEHTSMHTAEDASSSSWMQTEEWEKDIPECFSANVVCAFCKSGATEDEPLFLMSLRMRGLHDTIERLQERAVWCIPKTWNAPGIESDFVETLIDLREMDETSVTSKSHGYFLSCGHCAHDTCVQEYERVLMQRTGEPGLFEGIHLVRPSNHEWLCPLCRRVCNSIEELHPISEWQSDNLDDDGTGRRMPKLMRDNDEDDDPHDNDDTDKDDMGTLPTSMAEVWHHAKLLSWCLSSPEAADNNAAAALSSLRITTTHLLMNIVLDKHDLGCSEAMWQKHLIPMMAQPFHVQRKSLLSRDLSKVMLEWIILASANRAQLLTRMKSVLEILWPLAQIQDKVVEAILDETFADHGQTDVLDMELDDNYWNLLTCLRDHDSVEGDFVTAVKTRFDACATMWPSQDLTAVVDAIMLDPSTICHHINMDKDFVTSVRPRGPCSRLRGSHTLNLINMALVLTYCLGGHDDTVIKILHSNQVADDRYSTLVLSMLPATSTSTTNSELVGGHDELQWLIKTAMTKFVIGLTSVRTENIKLSNTRTLSKDEATIAYTTLLPPASIPSITHLPLVVGLPPLYSSLITTLTMGDKRVCTRCGTLPEHPVMCLLCGDLLCYRNACCVGDSRDWHGNRVHDLEEVQRHALGDEWDSWRSANDGTDRTVMSVVCRHKIHDMVPCLFLKSTMSWLFSQGGRVSSLGALYLDAWGEEDLHFKRGRPLELSEVRLANLKRNVLFGTFLLDSVTLGGTSLLRG